MSEAARLLERLDEQLAARDPDVSLAQLVCGACVELLGADGGYLALAASPHEDVTVWATDGAAARVAEIEQVVGEGPAHESWTAVAPTVVDLGAVSERWPAFLPAAASELGDVRLWVFPLRMGDRPFGVLATYASLDLGTSHDVAQVLADGAGQVLLQESWTRDAVDPDHLPRDLVHRATGMVAAQLGVSVDSALAVLRARAYVLGVPLAQVVQDVVGRRLTFGADG